ncbi:hypothetical protein [Marinicrinis sediminis]|uniref:HTH cro/C1-type domain-containing protein n=1 Tax=Marinicrinis sediminis TaxID=1652465 RepID=A0ABW5RFJ0_9BACL
MKITPNTIRIIRRVYRLTLEDMAAILNTSAAGMWRIEHDQRPLTADMVAKIKIELELTPAKLQRILEIYNELERNPTRMELARRKISITEVPSQV